VNGLAVLLPVYLGIVPYYARRQRRLAADGCKVAAMADRDGARPVSVDVIVTCYNEQPALLARCLRSLREQDYRGRTRVWVVDDGSENRAELLPVLATNAHPGWQVLLAERNCGKRVAQALALKEGKGQVVVTVDSDTVVAPDGIRRIVAPFRHRRVGAVTSSLRALNPDDSWLAGLIDTRYELLCERERAAQGYFGSVLCCAGPFSAFRRTAVQQVLRRYLRKRRSGDDLELTNLILEAGYRSEYQPAAKARTQVPTTLLEFALQQRRWNRSFYRELPRMLRIVARRRPYMVLDLVARTVTPPLVATAVLLAAADAWAAPGRLAFDAVALALMAVASVELLPPLTQASGRRFALRYGLVFVGLLLPVRLLAACTVLRDRWGTRRLRRRSSPDLAEQSPGVAFPDDVALLPVKGYGSFQFALRFKPATAQTQHLGEVDAHLGS
jgi:N-acetylglucosaminyltransferase